MKIADSRAPTDASRRRLLKQVGCSITAAGLAGVAGCTDTTASDEAERSEEIESFEGNGEPVDDPSPISQSDLAGTAFPDGPPEWIETNMDFRGYYDARAYLQRGPIWYSSTLEYKHWMSYFAQYAGYVIQGVFPGGKERSYAFDNRFGYHHGGTSPAEFSVVGSSAELRAYNPGSQNHEVWFGGTLGREYYWIGII